MDKFSKLGADGTVDIELSTAAYAEALAAWKAENEVDTGLIESAVEAVFDRFDGQRLPMPSLVFEALTELKATPAQHKALSKRIQGYVSGQCGVKDARNTGRLDIKNGVGGGVARLARPGEAIPARPQKA